MVVRRYKKVVEVVKYGNDWTFIKGKKEVVAKDKL